MRDGSGRTPCLSELSEQIEHFGRHVLAKRLLIGLAKGVSDAGGDSARLSVGDGRSPGACAVVAGVGVRLSAAFSVFIIIIEGQTESPAY